MHSVHVAYVLAHTLAALLDICRPFIEAMVTRCFSVDLRRPEEYISALHSIMAQWAAIVSSQLELEAMTAEERCSEMVLAELVRFRWQLREQPLLRCVPYRIPRPREMVAAGAKAAGARFEKVHWLKVMVALKAIICQVLTTSGAQGV